MNGWVGKEKIAKNDNTKYSKEDFIMNLTKASTAELVEELAKREAVERITVEPYAPYRIVTEDRNIEAGGPVVILRIWD